MSHPPTCIYKQYIHEQVPLLTMKKLSAFLHNLCGTETLPKRALSGIFKLPVHSLTPDYDEPIHPKITDRFRTINCCTRRGRPRGSPIPDAVNTSALAKHTVISYSLVYETHHAIATD